MLKDFLIVGAGSFLGGGTRYLVSKMAGAIALSSFPLGTFSVNVVGCLLIGFFSGLPTSGAWMSPQTKLFLTTGLCGGFTTFSTFMNENASLAEGHNYAILFLYLVGSFALGLICVWGGHAMAKMVA